MLLKKPKVIEILELGRPKTEDLSAVSVLDMLMFFGPKSSGQAAILMENSGYILQETGFKILMEVQP